MFLLNKQRTSSLFKHHLNKYSVNLPTTIQCPHSNKRSVKLHSKDKLHQMEVCFHRFQTVGKRNNGRGNAKRWSRFVNSKRRWRRNVLFENNSNVLKKSSSGSTFKIVVVSPSLLFFLVSWIVVPILSLVSQEGHQLHHRSVQRHYQLLLYLLIHNQLPLWSALHNQLLLLPFLLNHIQSHQFRGDESESESEEEDRELNNVIDSLQSSIDQRETEQSEEAKEMKRRLQRFKELQQNKSQCLREVGKEAEESLNKFKSSMQKLLSYEMRLLDIWRSSNGPMVCVGFGVDR